MRKYRGSWLVNLAITTALLGTVISPSNAEAKTIRTIKCGEKRWGDFLAAVRDYCNGPGGGEPCPYVHSFITCSYLDKQRRTQRPNVTFDIDDSTGELSTTSSLFDTSISFKYSRGKWRVQELKESCPE